MQNKGLVGVCLWCAMAWAGAAAGAAPARAGAADAAQYLPLLEGRRIGLAAHHASRVDGVHILDIMLGQGLNVARIFAPEHGFGGGRGAGETFKDERSPEGIPIVSLYRNAKKPSPQHLEGLDVVVADFQDVGVRCYTYLSTLYNIMEACAENGVPLVVFDRPNPNGHLVDGPVLEPRWRSFIGMLPIPLAHGMTLGELALMINGEGWLKGGIRCHLNVVKCQNYERGCPCVLEVPPSPNLPNQRAVLLYPSLCFFEGTIMSIGRGTPIAFQAAAHPAWSAQPPVFTPRRTPANKHPLFLNKPCRGIDLSSLEINDLCRSRQINLEWLVEAYRFFAPAFFNKQFNYLAGTDKLRRQIEAGMTPAAIRASWRADLAKFMAVRQKYLLYPDPAEP